MKPCSTAHEKARDRQWLLREWKRVQECRKSPMYGMPEGHSGISRMKRHAEKPSERKDPL
jgi:hypothetical protein